MVKLKTRILLLVLIMIFLKFCSARFVRFVLGDINKLTIAIFTNASDLKIWYYLKTSLPSSLEGISHKSISNNRGYIKTYSYVKHTIFSNDCIRWFVQNISEDVDENNNLCYEYETDVEF